MPHPVNPPAPINEVTEPGPLEAPRLAEFPQSVDPLPPERPHRLAPPEKVETERAPMMLVRSVVAFYGGVKAGQIAEIPTEIALQAIKSGAAERMDKLPARLMRAPTSAPGTVGYVEEPEPTDPMKERRTDPPKLPDPPATPEMPAKNASKALWFDFAVSQGMSESEADGMSKAKLAEHFEAERLHRPSE